MATVPFNPEARKMDYLSRLADWKERDIASVDPKPAEPMGVERDPAGKSPKQIVSETKQIVEGIMPMINAQSLQKVGIRKKEDLEQAHQLLKDAAEGRLKVPKQYEEANRYLSAFGREMRAKKTIAEAEYDDRVQEALRILQEEEKEEPMSTGEVLGRIALATAPSILGALLGGPGVGAGIAKGTREALEDSEKRKTARKDRLRKITEFGVEQDLKKSSEVLKGIMDSESEIDKSKAKLPIAYAEAAATLQQLGLKGLDGKSKQERDLYSDLINKVLLKAMENDKAKSEKDKEDKPTVGQQAVDKAFGQDYADYLQAGGSSSALSNIDMLEGAIKQMATSDMISGPRVQFMPGIMNPLKVKVQEDIESSIQNTLRIVLGSAYTEAEGRRVLARAFNPALEESENIARARRIMNNLRMMVGLKQRATKFFEQNGTLAGFTGTAEFDRLYNEIKGVETPGEGGAGKGEADGTVIKRVGPDGKVYTYKYNEKTGKYE